MNNYCGIIIFLLTVMSCNSPSRKIDPKIDTLKTYHNSGDLNDVFQIVDGKKEGLAKKYYKSGELHVEGVFKSDSLEEAKYYDKNGLIYNSYYNGQTFLYLYTIDGDTLLYEISRITEKIDQDSIKYYDVDSAAYFRNDSIKMAYSTNLYDTTEYFVWTPNTNKYDTIFGYNEMTMFRDSLLAKKKSQLTFYYFKTN